MLAALPVSLMLLVIDPNVSPNSASTNGDGLELVTTPISTQLAEPGEVSRCHLILHGFSPSMLPVAARVILAAVRATLVTPTPVVTNKVPALV